ncbi:unnamed protein product [Caenorhabditis sp. 36 PRJEB53466]|nr:unnamed protein product [Caenorhabditis sp. 36 PRJEB53466]
MDSTRIVMETTYLEEEDADSRDSGISMTSTSSADLPTDFSAMEMEQSISFKRKRTFSFSTVSGAKRPRIEDSCEQVVRGELGAQNALDMLKVKYTLPSAVRPQKNSSAYRSISPQTILSEMRRLGAAFSDRYALYDCRYPYEYAGGHLRGAVNLYKKSDIRMEFFDERKPKRIPIFYCEFSQKRGPSMANAVRSIDRVRNEHNYPHLEHPEMYLLDRGYKNLWDQPECREICAEPIGYLPMAHEDHTEEYRTARFERHRSSEMVKSNGEVEVEERIRSIRHRSSVRARSTVFRLNSMFSGSLSPASKEILEKSFRR